VRGEIQKVCARRQEGDKMKCTLVFFHIPHAGGTSIWEMLKKQKLRWFRLDYWAGTKQEFLQCDRSKIEVLIGHFGYGVLDYLEGETRCATLVRNPMARFASDFRYILSHPKHPQHRKVKGKTFYECVRDRLLAVKENGMVRFFASGAIEPVKGEVNETHLEKAKARLEGFDVVGITEHFSDFLADLGRVLGIHMKEEHWNVCGGGKMAKELDDDVRSLIEKRNALDVELFRFIEEKLRRRK